MRTLALLTLVSLVAATPAYAGDVDLNGTVTDSCSVNLGSPGTLTLSNTNTVLGSEETGGSAATFTVTSSGTAPIVWFATPGVVSAPAGWTHTGSDEIKFASTGGASQAYTAGASSFQMNSFMDSFTVNGRINETAGFASGNYVLRTVVTCGLD